MALSQSRIDQFLSLEGGDFTVKQANAIRTLLNEMNTSVISLEDNLGDLVVGDISGVADGEQLTYDSGTETWINGDPNPA